MQNDDLMHVKGLKKAERIKKGIEIYYIHTLNRIEYIKFKLNKANAFISDACQIALTLI